MCDFNLGPSSPLYDRIVGPLSPEYGRMNAIEGFVDTWVANGHGEREGITCPATGASPDQRIDYCFVSTPLLPPRVLDRRRRGGVGSPAGLDGPRSLTAPSRGSARSAW